MTDYRLPRHFVPLSYHIDLDASPKRQTFSGTVHVKGRLSAPSACVELHARGLKVSRAFAVSQKKKRQATIKLQKKRETVELIFAAPLAKGPLELSLTFAGKLDPAMHGLYLAKEAGERSLVSQCEATDARAIFPCCDEPDMKAALAWTVRTDPGLAVVTNGALSRTARAKGRAVHHFKATRPVSTYLAAITVGQYETTKTFKVSGTPCRIWCAPGKLSQTDFAREVTAYVLPWYEKYFGQPYHYQKLDQVAVTGFDAGAMENIGAIFYRQSRLLMQPGATSWFNQKAIAEVIAHEIAHQWFGNRVTMKWWDDLWLNEAFATWIAFKSIDEWKPEWRIWDDYQVDKEGALVADALVNTHPIYTPVKSPAEATELFDVITYSKGGAVLRMAEHFITADALRGGIQRYMARYKDGNAAGADLWNALGEASNAPVTELMESWIGQPGFPLLSVGLEDDGLRVSQRRFYSNPDKMSQNGADDQRWIVPLVVRGPHGVHRALVREREARVPLARADWYFPNADGIGFYRLELDETLLERLLARGLEHLTPAERVCLLEDEWALVRCGRSRSERFMNVLAAYAGETDYVVLGAIAQRLKFIDQRLAPDAARAKVAGLTRRLLADKLRRLGFEPQGKELPPVAVSRATLIGVLGDVGAANGVLEAAGALAARERKDPLSIEPNMARTVISLAAKRGDDKLLATYVETFLARQKGKAAPELQSRYLGALSWFTAAKLPEAVLALCLDGTVPQDQLLMVLVPLLTRRETQARAWAFLKKNWKAIGPRIGGMGISRLVEATSSLPREFKDDVAEFFAKHPVDEAARALKKALEAIDLNAQLVAREAPRLAAWLDANVSESA